MEREAINEFIDNLIQEKDVSTDDAIELKEILEISAKDIESRKLPIFLKTVKDSINASSNNFFSVHGVDFYSIKNIAEKIALEVKKEQQIENDVPNNKDNIVESEFIQLNTEEILDYKVFEEVIPWITSHYPNIGIVTAIDMAKRIPKIKKAMHEYEEAKQSGDEEKMQQIRESVDGVDKIVAITELEMRAREMAEKEGINYEEALEHEINRNEFIKDEFAEYTTIEKGQEYFTPVVTDDVYNNTGFGHLPNKEILLTNFTETKKYEDKEIRKNADNQEVPIRQNKINITNMSISKKISLFKYNFAIETRKKALEELERLEQALQEGLDVTWDANRTDLPQISAKIIEAKRKEREARQIMLSIRETSDLDISYNDESIEKGNTLLNDEEKRKLIIDLYYKQSLSAVEIYEQLKESGIIEDSYLIPEDVIEVVASEASKYCSPSEVEKVIEREREIEKLRKRENIYERIYENAEARHKKCEMEDCIRRIESVRLDRKTLNKEGFEFRQKVSRHQETQKSQMSFDSQITFLQGKNSSLKKGSEYFSQESNRKDSFKKFNEMFKRKGVEFSDITRERQEVKETIARDTKMKRQQSQEEHENRDDEK